MYVRFVVFIVDESFMSCVCMKAIWAVGNIAAEGKFRDSLIENNALKRLLDTLSSVPIELSTQRIGTWALANFVRHRLRALDPEVVGRFELN